MYVVQNLTDRTIMLSDIRAEIGPRQVIDLERIASRDSIDRSFDLKNAKSLGYLGLVKHTVVKLPTEATPPPPSQVIEKTTERIIEKESFNEQKIRDMITELAAQQKEALDKNLHSVNSGIKDFLGSLRDKMNSVNVPLPTQQQQESIETHIDPVKLAEMHQKSIDKMSKNIETNAPSQQKRIIIKNTNISNIADEL